MTVEMNETTALSVVEAIRFAASKGGFMEFQEAVWLANELEAIMDKEDES